MNNYIIKSISNSKTHGFYYKINTKLNSLYKVKIKMKLKKGDKCYFYYENDKGEIYINKDENIFYLGKEKKIKYKIKGTGKSINIGIVFKNTNINYELQVDNFNILNNDIILNNVKNIILCEGTSININNNDKLSQSIVNINEVQNNEKFNNEFNKRGIKQVYVSMSLKHFGRIRKIYNLRKYDNKNEPLLIFGAYDSQDVDIIKNHPNLKYIMWGGSDADNRIKCAKNIIGKIKMIKNVKHFSISDNLFTRLKNNGFNSERIKFNLADPELFKPIKNDNADSIYIYNGFSKEKEWIYGQEIYEEIIKRLPEYNYILSNQLNVAHEEMPNIYSKCLIGLRLTQNDGNANTSQEMELMNIPIVHNGESKNCIKWDTVDDVELAIRYRNIDLFNDNIKQYTNILFVCNDYPSYGGAATNAYKLIKWYENKGHKTFGIFTHYDKKPVTWNNEDKNIIIDTDQNTFKMSLKKCNEYFSGDPNLIIFRSYNNHNHFKHINCPKYLLVPGLFLNNLDKSFKDITDSEIDKYINKRTIELCKNVDKIFAASQHTILLLEKYYKIKAYPLYFNYIPFYGDKIIADKHFNERKYDFGIIQSNFNRKIKNIDQVIEILKPYKKKVILIGEGSDKYKNYGFKCKKLLSNEKAMKYMSIIKCIVQNSHYESYSNVIMEARFNGCKIITNINELNKILDNIDKVTSNTQVNTLVNVPTSVPVNVQASVPTSVPTSIPVNVQASVPVNVPVVNTKNLLDKKILKDNSKIKILISSTQYPGFGGAATNAYKLIIYLRKQGYKCVGVFINNYEDRNICCDEEKIGNIYNFVSDYNFNNIKNNEEIKNQIINSLGGNPDICFGKNYVAPYANKILFKNSLNIYLVSGLSYSITNENMIDEYINNINQNKFNYTEFEKRTLDNSDYVICNSKLLYDVFKKIYKNYDNKIYNNIIDTSKYDEILDNNINISNEKEYDIILVCSSFSRKEKNFEIIAEMLKSDKFDKYKKCIIGKNSEIFKNINNKIIYDLQTNMVTKKLISKSKLMLIPSFFEANSNAVREAINNNCLVLLNKNVGWNECFPNTLICESYKISEWEEKTLNILTNYDTYKNITINFPSNIELDQFIDEKINNKKFDLEDLSLTPKVSIIMTVYNKEKYVDDSIKSILNQTYKNIELIIVEDCSTDKSKDIVNKYLKYSSQEQEGVDVPCHPNIKIIYNDKNKGCYSSRNIALSNSSGDIIGFQDADDYSVKNRIEKQVKLMKKNNLLMCGCNIIRSNLKKINYDDEKKLLLEIKNDTGKVYFGYATLLIKKSLFNKYGPFIERRKGMDMEYGDRILHYECKIDLTKENSWNYFNKKNNKIYMKINEILYICPKMDKSNITKYETDDEFLKNRSWRNSYKKN